MSSRGAWSSNELQGPNYMTEYHDSSSVMAARLPNKFSWIIFFHLMLISLEFIRKGHSKSVLIYGMAWWKAGDKPLPELMMTYFTNAYGYHYFHLCIFLQTLAPVLFTDKFSYIFMTNWGTLLWISVRRFLYWILQTEMFLISSCSSLCPIHLSDQQFYCLLRCDLY